MILVDTGPIVAVINDRDDHHRECTHLLERLPGPLLIPVTVATEVCLMLERRRGTYAELAFLADVRAGRYTPAVGHRGCLGDRAGRAPEHHHRGHSRPP